MYSSGRREESIDSFHNVWNGCCRRDHSPSISIKVFPDSGQIHADKCPGPGGLAGPDMACCCNGFPWTAHTRDPSGRFCMTQSGVFTIFDIAQILTSSFSGSALQVHPRHVCWAAEKRVYCIASEVSNERASRHIRTYDRRPLLPDWGRLVA